MDRRTALAGIAGATSSWALEGPSAAVLHASTTLPLGHWNTDADGLPCYIFAGDVPVKTTTPAGLSYPLEPDPVFLLGNYDLTLFLFASGQMRLVSGERGWVRLNEPTAMVAGNGATLTVADGSLQRTHTLLGINGVSSSGHRTRRMFGCGTARYLMAPQAGLTVERILSVAPSTAARRAEPAVVITVRLTNTGPRPLYLDYVETVLSNPTLALNRASASGVRPVKFDNKARAFPRGIACNATATSDDPAVLTPIDVPNRYNLYPPALVLTAPKIAEATDVDFSHRAVDGGAVELVARSSVNLAPGATRDIVLAVALQSEEADPASLPVFVSALDPSPSGDWFRREWAEVLAPLATVPDPALRAELLWDGHALLAMATYAAYYRQTFIPQGMTYDYVIDLNAGPRDHLQHAMGAAYFAPELARSSILYTLCRMTGTGALKFTVSGNGMTADSTWSPSDQSLFLFYAMGEYLRITRDCSILDVETPYLSQEPTLVGTVLEKLQRAFLYLRDHVATGPHGLVRLLTGDWNDLIYVGVPDGLHRDVAESHMNSAMVMAVLPSLIEQLGTCARTRSTEEAVIIGQLTREMETYTKSISQAMMRDLDGRSFARRAWLGAETALGENDMHLEPQSFLLQAPNFPVERKRALWREMQRRLMTDEALGPRQREHPRADGRMAAGTGENGGFWYSLAGHAIAGVATFDRKAALALLDRMTFRSFAHRHPNYWVGQWTAPDTLNAEITGDVGGLPRSMDDGQYLKMASYCAHAHAWPIYSYFQIRDALCNDGRVRPRF